MNLQHFPWSALFETGVPLIDSQHRVLVELTNQLGDSLMQGQTDPVAETLERLKAYAAQHFTDEEAWSLEAGQPAGALAAHHAQHASFSAQVMQFANGGTGDPEQGVALHRFLCGWLVAHIMGDDRRMVQHLSQQAGSRLTPPAALGDGEQLLLEAASNLHHALGGLANDLERQVKARTAELELSNQRLRSNFLTSVRTYTNLLSLRGGQLAAHSRRTADLARQLARQLGLDPVSTQQVFLGALLHEIGKIGLPDDLLGKPVALLKGHDLTMYRAYPVVGETALMAIADLPGAIRAVRSHHERWDGRGFPDGLSGEQIPLEARIVGVASDIGNLQHGLYVARRLSLDEALQLVVASRGERYDPQVVDALTIVLGRGAADAVTPPERGPEREVYCTALRPGMSLTRDLITPEGMLLLAAGHTLEAQTISRIQHFIATGGLLNLKVHVKPVEQADGQSG